MIPYPIPTPIPYPVPYSIRTPIPALSLGHLGLRPQGRAGPSPPLGGGAYVRRCLTLALAEAG